MAVDEEEAVASAALEREGGTENDRAIAPEDHRVFPRVGHRLDDMGEAVLARRIALSLFALAFAGAVVGVALSRRAAERNLVDLALARQAAERNLVDLGACLLGEPLAADEKASDRMARIELARPSAPPSDHGIQPRTQPETCARYADAASRSPLPPDHQHALAKLAQALADKDVASAAAADAMDWFRERRDLSASTVRVGMSAENESTWFDGEIAEVRISKTALYPDSFTPPKPPLAIVVGSTIALYRSTGAHDNIAAERCA